MMINVGRIVRMGARAYRRRRFAGLLNHFLSCCDAALHFDYALAQPSFLQASVVEGICNLSCNFCNAATSAGRAAMTLETFRQLLDKFSHVHSVVLSGWGEPFLVEDIYRIIAYAKSRPCHVGVTTNMTLVDAAAADKLVGLGLDTLFISFDAGVPETYERIRAGARFDTVVANIRTLDGVKRARKARLPRLCFFVTAMKSNIQEIPAIVGLASQLGVEYVKVNPVRVVSGSGLCPADGLAPDAAGAAETIFRSAARLARQHRIEFIYPDLRRHGVRGLEDYACRQPWIMPTVYMDGSLGSCCLKRFSSHNVLERPLGELWNSRTVRRVRAAVRKEKSICPYCAQAIERVT